MGGVYVGYYSNHPKLALEEKNSCTLTRKLFIDISHLLHLIPSLSVDDISDGQ